VTTLVSSLAHDPDRPFHPRDPRQNNDFTYAADQDGRQVPLGSHMRWMNPRDTKMTVLADVNIHRIIRRSTAFGARTGVASRSGLSGVSSPTHTASEIPIRRSVRQSRSCQDESPPRTPAPAEGRVGAS
jgi:hypothetical protein